ncbi:MAG: hypothetical protein RIE58_07735 [Vicingaceae bacterium]
MKFKYEVDVLELKEVHEIPDAWNKGDFLKLLDKIEYEDANSIPDNELKEMTIMALSDLEPEEAAELVLEVRLGEKLTVGQRKNLSEELKDDRLWEEYAEISFHEELFNVGCMIHWAYPRIYPYPDIVRLKLGITSKNSESKINLQNPTASFLARLLSDGMNEHNTIFRLFKENVKGNSFPASEDIIWKFQGNDFKEATNSLEVTIFTSWNWVDELKGVDQFESNAFADGQIDV